MKHTWALSKVCMNEMFNLFKFDERHRVSNTVCIVYFFRYSA